MLVDTGSSTTLLDKQFVPQNVHITQPDTPIQLHGVTGHLIGNILGTALIPYGFVHNGESSTVVFNTVIFDGETLKIPHGLIGVNFLTHFEVNLNFSQLTFEMKGTLFLLREAPSRAGEVSEDGETSMPVSAANGTAPSRTKQPYKCSINMMDSGAPDTQHGSAVQRSERNQEHMRNPAQDNEDPGIGSLQGHTATSQGSDTAAQGVTDSVTRDKSNIDIHKGDTQGGLHRHDQPSEGEISLPLGNTTVVGRSQTAPRLSSPQQAPAQQQLNPTANEFIPGTGKDGAALMTSASTTPQYPLPPSPAHEWPPDRPPQGTPGAGGQLVTPPGLPAKPPEQGKAAQAPATRQVLSFPYQPQDRTACVIIIRDELVIGPWEVKTYVVSFQTRSTRTATVRPNAVRSATYHPSRPKDLRVTVLRRRIPPNCTFLPIYENDERTIIRPEPVYNNLVLPPRPVEHPTTTSSGVLVATGLVSSMCLFQVLWVWPAVLSCSAV